ncbi:Muscarinic acetylcholine receptor gar-2 [Aphelenchoides besseyi]|nr:Muscarinic acetylcholine receptor gar-2 [Aphelenchoides besseyi]KAI6201798.1 Muscarinic acetylcholine receptor gar-2 [Aphelenchoides besseyi]
MSEALGDGTINTLSTVASTSFSNVGVAETNLSAAAVAEELGVASWLLVFVMGIMSVVTVAGNLIVLLSYYLDKNIRQPSNYFIFSLAVSDLIIGLEGIPVYTYFFIRNQHWPFGAFLCDLWLSIDYSCCLASIYTVFGLAADRFCSVKYPAAYRNWRTQKKILLIIAITWIVPSVLFSVSIFGYSLFSGRGRILKDDECYVQFMTNAYLNMGMYIVYYWSTLALMLYCYYGIYTAAKQLAIKSDQKQKRLALLSEMRKTNKRDTPSIIAASEANLSNSAAESQADTSDSIYSRNNIINVTIDNGKVVKNAMESQSTEKSLDKMERTWNKSFEQSERSFDRSFDKSERSFDRSELTEKSLDRPEISERSMDLEPSISISVHPVDVDEISFPFSIDDEIPFIDEDSLTSLSKSIRVEKNAIPLHSFFREKNGPFPAVAVPSNTPASPSPVSAYISTTQTSINFVRAEPITLLPERTADPLFLNNNYRSLSTCVKPWKKPSVNNHQSHVHRNTCSSLIDRPTMTSDTPPHSNNTYASLSVLVEKSSSANGPMSMRRLLTVMRNQSGRRRPKRRKLAQVKNIHSRSENRARKALRTITVILGTFVILWTPFYILATIYGFCERCKISYEFNLLYTISYYLCYANSVVNPICYAFANQQFKRAFKRILHGDFRRT